MPRGKPDHTSPETAEKLRLEIAELENKRAELSALLQLPLTIESMEQRIKDLDAEFDKTRHEKLEDHETLIHSLTAHYEGRKKTLESQLVRLNEEQQRLGADIILKEQTKLGANVILKEINEKLLERSKTLGKLKDDCEYAEEILRQKGSQMNALLEGFQAELKKLGEEREALERTKAELKAKDHNLANLQTVLNMQLADARDRLFAVELREKDVAEAHAKNCADYNDNLTRGARQEEDYKQKVIVFNRRVLSVEQQEIVFKTREEALTARENDLATNWEVFKKERAKYEWANREK